ncbi:hypothetical protein [Paracoccus suum]|nr:hypothetical protein [Paracoccus suum]
MFQAIVDTPRSGNRTSMLIAGFGSLLGATPTLARMMAAPIW